VIYLAKLQTSRTQVVKQRMDITSRNLSVQQSRGKENACFRQHIVAVTQVFDLVKLWSDE
jgi:hypothetical protein